MFLEAVILHANLAIGNDRTIQGIYHILSGKKSIQTLQDARIYELERFFGICKNLPLRVYRDKVNQMVEKEWIKQDPDDNKKFQVSTKAKQMVDRYSKMQAFQYFNGLRYADYDQLFLDRFYMLVQTFTNSKMKHFSFIPVVDNRDVLDWIKKFYKDHHAEIDNVLANLYQDLLFVLGRLAVREANLFVDRLTGYKSYGMSMDQLAQKYKITAEDAALLLTGISHQLIAIVSHFEKELSILPSLLDGMTNRKLLTDSALKTYTMLLNGDSISAIAAKRRIKRNTVYDHVVEISLYDKSFSIDSYVQQNEQKEIQQAVNQLKTYRVKEIKDAVSSNISYFQIRLVLAKITKGAKGINA